MGITDMTGLLFINWDFPKNRIMSVSKVFNKMQLCYIFISWIATLCYSGINAGDQTIKYAVRFKDRIYHNFSENGLGTANIVYSITPWTYIVEVSLQKEHRQNLKTLLEETFSSMIVEMEPVRTYIDDLKPEETAFGGAHTDKQPDMRNTSKNLMQLLLDPTSHTANTFEQLPTPNLVCSHYYGMGVPEAWAAGYTGKGVVVAITDVGINTDLKDLSDNIHKTLSYNFILNNNDTTPEYLHNIQDKSQFYTDHGNRMAGIIAAIKGNNLCSAGIAYNATLVDLKIYEVKEINFLPSLHPSHWTRSDVVSRALRYKLDKIDIFANAWGPENPFDKLDLATRDAVDYSAKFGRKGLGTIHIVPSGPPGNGLANNIHTITVNAVGQNGTIPDDVFSDASVLTSGLAFGNNLTSRSAVTTSFRNKCISTFSGVSLATAQISGITALALEANKFLSLRDLQNLIVRNSEFRGLLERNSVHLNAAKRKFNGIFGFGLLNASKLVSSAKDWKPVAKLLSTTVMPVSRNGNSFLFCHDCIDTDENCLTTIEHVVLSVRIRSSAFQVRMEVKSSHDTSSVILDHSAKRNIQFNTTEFVSVHFWDEAAFGPWSLNVQHEPRFEDIFIDDVKLVLYGTHRSDVRSNKEEFRDLCNWKNDNQDDDKVNETIVVEEDVDSSSKSNNFYLGLLVGITLDVVIGIIIVSIVAIRHFIQRFVVWTDQTYESNLLIREGSEYNILSIG